MLVIDVTKGLQTQTAECLVIGQITCKKMVVVLNKIDLLPLEKKETAIEKVFVMYLLELRQLSQTCTFNNNNPSYKICSDKIICR